MRSILPYRAYDTDGVLAARDGIVFVLFIEGDHHEIAGSVGELYDRYCEIFGCERLKWAHDRGESFRPLTKRKRTSVRKMLSAEHAKPGKDYFVTLKSGEEDGDAPEHLFQYRGMERATTPRADEWPYRSFVEIWFPNEHLHEQGPAKMVSDLGTLAELVPFSSGYCSRAINCEEWAEGLIEEEIRGLVTRHPGLDFHASMITTLQINNHTRGAYWLTLLGPDSLQTLQADADSARASLGQDIIVHELTNGIMIQAGETPEIGDVNRGDNLPLVRKVASFIEPILLIQTSGIFIFDEEDEFEEWTRRHLR